MNNETRVGKNRRSGKSTLTDLILGLITLTEGHILIDGEKLSQSNVKAWQCKNVFLSNASILENIAFGVPRQQIDLDRVRKVAEQAKLNELIKDLPEGWQTKVGERGIRLSGGQC